MDQINKYHFEEILLKNSLIRIGDLINMDGPMLVLFKNILNDDLYLFDWVDNDEVSNRWLIYKVDKSDLLSFIKTKKSYKNLFDRNNSTIYFTDIDSNNFNQYKIYELRGIPETYKPDRDVLFDLNDSKNLDKILKELNLDSELNEKNSTQYNVILSSGVLVGFETQENYVDQNWPVMANRLTHISHYITAYQPNVSKSNRIPEKKRLVLQ